MKKTLFVILTLGFTLLGFYAGANPLETEEAKEDTAISMNQAPDMESEKAERNAFANVGLESSYLFFHSDDNHSDFTLHFSTDYGVVFGKSAIADAGILEGKVGIHGNYNWDSYATVHSSSYLIGGSFGIDINFIKNDGINKWIPGVFLGAGVSYYKRHNDESYTKNSRNYIKSSIIGGVTVGAILKAFVSKQLAIVPFLGVEYSRAYITHKKFHLPPLPIPQGVLRAWGIEKEEASDQFVDSSSNSFTIHMGLGLRYYF